MNFIRVEILSFPLYIRGASGPGLHLLERWTVAVYYIGIVRNIIDDLDASFFKFGVPLRFYWTGELDEVQSFSRTDGDGFAEGLNFG